MFFQPSQFPHLKTEFSSETQFSSGYLENSGSLAVGDEEHKFLNRISLQDSDGHKERGVTLSWENVSRGNLYKVEFLTKVIMALKSLFFSNCC